MVSEKMNVLARNHQIICITHLPQIAAMADAHYLIEKSVENKTTVSKIKCLSGEDSIDELAKNARRCGDHRESPGECKRDERTCISEKMPLIDTKKTV